MVLINCFCYSFEVWKVIYNVIWNRIEDLYIFNLEFSIRDINNINIIYVFVRIDKCDIVKYIIDMINERYVSD